MGQSPLAGAWWLSFVCLTMVSLPSVTSAEEGIQERFFSEAPAGWKKLKDFSRNVHLVYGERRDSDAAGSSEPDETRSEIKIRGDSSLIHKVGPTIEKVGVTTPKFSFGIKRHSPQDEWEVMYIGRPREEFNWEIEEPVNSNARLSYTFMGIPLDELVKSSDVALGSVTEVNDDTTGKSLVRLEYECVGGELEFPTGKAPVQGGWFLLDPDLYWAICEAGIRLPDANWRILVRYGIDGDGRPIVESKEEIVEHRKGANAGKVSSVGYDFVAYEHKVVPESDFLPSTYGLPNPVSIDTSSPSGRTWLFLFGNFVLVIGIAVYWYYRRFSRTSDSN